MAVGVHEGRNVVVCPEGTRGFDYHLRPFKKGPFVLAIASRRPIAPDAYDLYLKGRYLWNTRTRDGLSEAARCFEQAIERHQDYAAAYAGLADVYLTQLDYNYLLPRDAFALANRAVLEALRLDDTLADPHTSLGHLRLHEFNWRAAEQEFTRAIDFNPSYATAHYYYGNLLVALGRSNEAVAEARRVLEIDPMSANARQNLAQLLYFAGATLPKSWKDLLPI